MKLLISQKDKIFEFIGEAGLSHSLFEWTEINSVLKVGHKTSILGYKGSEFMYGFETGHHNDHYAIFCPGHEEYNQEIYLGPWEEQCEYFKNWLTYLKREISAPNKWERFNKELAQLDFNTEQDDNQFNYKEVEEITKNVNLLRTKIQKIENLSENSIKILNDKLDYLIEQSKVLQKFDWRSLFVGTILNIIMALLIPPDAAKALWKAISEVFPNLLLLKP